RTFGNARRRDARETFHRPEACATTVLAKLRPAARAGSNPKAEIRNPTPLRQSAARRREEARNPKPESEEPWARGSDFGLRISFGFRASGFGFPTHGNNRTRKKFPG